jgi:hypothetical protein
MKGSPKKRMERPNEVPPTKKVRRTALHGQDHMQDHFLDLVASKKYVDKTMFIEKLEQLIEETQKQSIVCFRPKRFGKSLTICMLKNYYDVRTLYDKTFQDLYIGKNPTKRAHGHLVLMLDFSGIDTTSFEAFEVSINNKLNDDMKEFQEYYEGELSENPFQVMRVTPSVLFGDFSHLFLYLGNLYIYVLVDEYDASINESLGNMELAKSTFNPIQD